MTRIRLTKIFHFEMAHALYGYDGPCRNIHGHSYQLEVTVSGEPLDDPENPKHGMVIDFTDLKSIVTEQVVHRLDHALILNGNSPHRNIPQLDQNFEKVVFVEYQPTCENMLADFAERIGKLLPGRVRLESMKLKETPNSYAEWVAADQKH
jgi:6-pyruvoyltetrahydropterin/6-carboxytetrahydropterin synthase